MKDEKNPLKPILDLPPGTVIEGVLGKPGFTVKPPMTDQQHNAFPKGRWASDPTHPANPDPLDTSNIFGVLPEHTYRSDGVRLLLPVPDVMSKDLAWNLCAWIIATTFGDAEVAKRLKQIRAVPASPASPESKVQSPKSGDCA